MGDVAFHSNLGELDRTWSRRFLDHHRQAIHRGSFPSVPELIAVIRRFVDGWNECCEPFVWTKTADVILPHAKMIKKLK
jgi:hypothetical protein